MLRTALIAGATGLVGSSLLTQLLAHPGYGQVRVLGRRAPALSHAKLVFVPSTLENLDALPGASLAVDDVYCCLGTTTAKAGGRAGLERVDYHMVVGLARAAQAQGAKQFLVVSAAGASGKSPAFYSRVKARMEQAVAAAGYATVHIVRPSLLLGARSESRPAEALAQKIAPLLAPFCIGPLRKYRPITGNDVAAAMIALANAGAAGVQVHDLPL
ncbi:MAG: oxidoreductase [Nevskia sp.]